MLHQITQTYLKYPVDKRKCFVYFYRIIERCDRDKNKYIPRKQLTIDDTVDTTRT